MATPMHTLHNIQVLRATAAIMVVMHHTFPHYAAMGITLPFLESLANWGFVGVDIFFIISGFIMAYTTFNKPRGVQSAKTFIQHRLFRIYLGYIPFLLIMILVLWHFNPEKLTHLDIVGSFSLLNANMYQLVLPVSWSLSFELYFYLLFLATFFISLQKLYTYLPLFTILLLGLVLFATYSDSLPISFFYSSFLLEFFLGVLLYMYKEYLIYNWLLVVAIIIMLLSFWIGVEYETKNGLVRVATFGVSACTLVLSALILESKNFSYKKGFLASLGNASYTLYLSHLVFLELFYFTGLRNIFNSTEMFLSLLGYFFVLSITIIFSLYYYRFIEKPLYKKAITRYTS